MALDGLRALWAINIEGLHHVRIVCFHAAGAIATEQIDIKTSINRLIQVLICLFMKNSVQAGWDPTISRNHVLTPFGWYRKVESFFESPCYIGKGIQVYKLKAGSHNLPSSSSGHPQTLVMKKVWGPHRAIETEAITSVFQQTRGVQVFGLATWLRPEVSKLSFPRSGSMLKIATRKMCIEDDTEFFANGLEKEQLMRLSFYGLRDVQHLPTQPLTEAILHAAIGHYKLYELGWVHRDISAGNVLLVKDGVSRQSPFESLSSTPFENLPQLALKTDCKAFLHDLDLAYPYKRDKRVFQAHVVGTRVYLSYRLIEQRARNSGPFLVQNSIDDLESFVWLLMHVAYDKKSNRSGFTATDREMLSRFEHTCSDTKMVQHKKALLDHHLNRLHWGEPSGILPLKQLIGKLLTFLCAQRLKLSKLDSLSVCWEDIQALVIESYQFFFQEILQVLPALPNNWNA